MIKEKTPNILSHTRINKFLTCGKAYEYHYVDKLRPIKMNSPLLFGAAIDKALNDLLETKDLSKAKEVFDQTWSKQTYNYQQVDLTNNPNIKFSKSDLEEKLLTEEEMLLEVPKRYWTSMKKKGHLFLEAYNEKVLPLIKDVVAVQKEVKISNDDGDSITGYIDCILKWEDDKTYIADNKTTTVKYGENSAGESDQLALYYHDQQNELKLDGVMFIVLDKKIKFKTIKTCSKCHSVFVSKNNKRCTHVDKETKELCNSDLAVSYKPEVDINIYKSKVSERKENEVLEKFDIANNGIHNKEFEKNYKSCESVYGRCEFYNLCHFGRDDDLIKLESKKDDK